MQNLNKQTKRILGDELEEILIILEAHDKANERQAKINLYLLGTIIISILIDAVQIIKPFM